MATLVSKELPPLRGKGDTWQSSLHQHVMYVHTVHVAKHTLDCVSSPMYFSDTGICNHYVADIDGVVNRSFFLMVCNI